MLIEHAVAALGARFRIFAGVAVLNALAASQSVADLTVFPQRLVITRDRPTGTLTVRNGGAEHLHVRIRPVFYRMSEDGKVQVVDQPLPGDHSAQEALTFSPREADLESGQEQVIRVAVNPAKFVGSESEYREHLRFEPVSSTPGLDRVAVAIPVIYRAGHARVHAWLTRSRLERASRFSVAYVGVLAQGEGAFAFGDLEALWQRPGLAPIVVGRLSGLSSYAPLRAIRCELTSPGGAPLESGWLEVRFRTSDANGAEVLTSVELPLE